LNFAAFARAETCLLCRPPKYIGAWLPMWRNWQTRQTQNHYKSLGIKWKYLDSNALACLTKNSKWTGWDCFGLIFKRAGYNTGCNVDLTHKGEVATSKISLPIELQTNEQKHISC
jgi:hypothetical protein